MKLARVEASTAQTSKRLKKLRREAGALRPTDERLPGVGELYLSPYIIVFSIQIFEFFCKNYIDFLKINLL